MSVPDYRWFDQAPEHFKTRNQLGELGLKPGGPCVATVTWKKGQRFAYLYDEQAAVPKRVLTEAQRAALDKAREAADRKARTCPACGDLCDWRLGPRERCGRCRAESAARRWRRDRTDAALWAQRLLATPNALALDGETTDVSGVIVQMSVVALDGTVLLNTLVNPLAAIAPEAEAIHHISQTQAECAPPFADQVDRLASLLHGHVVVAYNCGFDAETLERDVGRLYAGQPDAWQRAAAWCNAISWEDAMEPWAAHCGQWSSRHGKYRWQPLGGSHDAADDCQQLLRIIRIMADDIPEEVPLKQRFLGQFLG